MSPRSPRRPLSLTEYPTPPSADPLSLRARQQLLLVARHSPCLAESCPCPGWKPAADSSPGLECRECRHDPGQHGMDDVQGLDEEERERRIKVATRIDELLNVLQLPETL